MTNNFGIGSHNHNRYRGPTCFKLRNHVEEKNVRTTYIRRHSLGLIKKELHEQLKGHKEVLFVILLLHSFFLDLLLHYSCVMLDELLSHLRALHMGHWCNNLSEVILITLVRKGKWKRKEIDDAETKNTCFKSMVGPNMNSNKTLVHTNKFYSAFIYSLIQILRDTFC